MSLKRLVIAMASLAILAGIMASSAMAGATTGGRWFVNGGLLSGSESVKCHASGTLKLEGSVGTNHTPITMTATGVECIEATIFNEGGAAKDAGKLKFTGVTVDTPLHCTVENGTVETNALSTELYMDSTEPSITFDRFEPAPEVANFAIVHLTGAECSVAGNRPAKGFVYGQASNPTNTPALAQPLNFSAAIDTTAGSALTFASNPATLTGTAVNELTSGNEFEARP